MKSCQLKFFKIKLPNDFAISQRSIIIYMAFFLISSSTKAVLLYKLVQTETIPKTYKGFLEHKN